MALMALIVIETVAGVFAFVPIIVAYIFGMVAGVFALVITIVAFSWFLPLPVPA